MTESPSARSSSRSCRWCRRCCRTRQAPAARGMDCDRSDHRRRGNGGADRDVQQLAATGGTVTAMSAPKGLVLPQVRPLVRCSRFPKGHPVGRPSPRCRRWRTARHRSGRCEGPTRAGGSRRSPRFRRADAQHLEVLVVAVAGLGVVAAGRDGHHQQSVLGGVQQRVMVELTFRPRPLVARSRGTRGRSESGSRRRRRRTASRARWVLQFPVSRSCPMPSSRPSPTDCR